MADNKELSAIVKLRASRVQTPRDGANSPSPINNLPMVSAPSRFKPTERSITPVFDVKGSATDNHSDKGSATSLIAKISETKGALSLGLVPWSLGRLNYQVGAPLEGVDQVKPLTAPFGLQVSQEGNVFAWSEVPASDQRKVLAAGEQLDQNNKALEVMSKGLVTTSQPEVNISIDQFMNEVATSGKPQVVTQAFEGIAIIDTKKPELGPSPVTGQLPAQPILPEPEMSSLPMGVADSSVEAGIDSSMQTFILSGPVKIV